MAAVDYSNASSLALLDPRTRTWSRAGAGGRRARRGHAPGELAAGTQPVGPVTAAFADATGLSPDTVVAVGCGDEMAATLGAGVFAPGEVCDVVGHGRAGLRGVGRAARRPDDARRVPSARRPRRVAAGEPGVRLRRQPPVVAGPVRRRRARRRVAGEGDAYDLLSREAAAFRRAPRAWCSSRACRARWRPEWNGAARGVFYGLTLAHTRRHMTRAMLEGSAFALRDILEAMRGAGLEVRRLTIVGGRREGRPVATDQGRRHGAAGPRAEPSRRPRPARRSSRRSGRGCTRPSGRRGRVRRVPAGGARARPGAAELRRGVPAVPACLLRAPAGLRGLLIGQGRSR